MGLSPPWPHFFGKWLPIPFHPKGKSRPTPCFLPSGHYPPLPEGHSAPSHPSASFLQTQPRPGSSSGFSQSLCGFVLSLASHVSPTPPPTLPSSRREQTKAALPPGFTAFPQPDWFWPAGLGLGTSLGSSNNP